MKCVIIRIHSKNKLEINYWVYETGIRSLSIGNNLIKNPSICVEPSGVISLVSSLLSKRRNQERGR
jgi:hypothetical protein